MLAAPSTPAQLRGRTMFRTYPLGTTGPRRPESLRDIIRRIERDLAADPDRLARRRALVGTRPSALF